MLYQLLLKLWAACSKSRYLFYSQKRSKYKYQFLFLAKNKTNFRLTKYSKLKLYHLTHFYKEKNHICCHIYRNIQCNLSILHMRQKAYNIYFVVDFTYIQEVMKCIFIFQFSTFSQCDCLFSLFLTKWEYFVMLVKKDQTTLTSL